MAPDASSGAGSAAAWIESIAVGEYSHTSGDDAGSGDFTSDSVDLAIGSEIAVTLTPGFPDTSRYHVRRLSQQM